MTTIKSLRLHQCATCKNEQKLPYAGNVETWCFQCKAMTLHVKLAEHELTENIDARMQRFLATVSTAKGRKPSEDPKPSRDATIAKLRNGGYPSRQIEGLRAMHGQGLEMANRLRNFRRKDSHYVLYGGNGTGKTQIATRIAAVRFHDGLSAGRYATVPDLFNAMKSAISRDQPQDELLRPYRTSGFLVLDEAQDMGSSDKGAQWCLEALRTIADVRYREFRPMLWLMNANSAAEVSERLGARIIDRVNETGGLIHCNWPSYRTPEPEAVRQPYRD